MAKPKPDYKNSNVTTLSHISVCCNFPGLQIQFVILTYPSFKYTIYTQCEELKSIANFLSTRTRTGDSIHHVVDIR